MTPEIRSQLNKLKKDIADFESYIMEIDRKQIDFPLDKNSSIVIHTDVVLQEGAIYSYNAVPYDDSQQITINGKLYTIATSKIV